MELRHELITHRIQGGLLDVLVFRSTYSFSDRRNWDLRVEWEEEAAEEGGEESTGWIGADTSNNEDELR
jgi:hypothetical protein